MNIRQQMKNEANELWELNRPGTRIWSNPVQMNKSVYVKSFGYAFSRFWGMRLGAMGLAERKEVNLDFSKEDEEKREPLSSLKRKQ